MEFVSFREQIDTAGPLGRSVVVIVGAITELELWPHSPLPNQQPPIHSIAKTRSGWRLEINGRNGFRLLSRRARHFDNEAKFAQYAVARRLPKNVLHHKMSGTVWVAFMRGEFDVASFQAMKAVEVSVRDARGLGNDLTGVSLMRAAH